jgi:hypothetical protein
MRASIFKQIYLFFVFRKKLHKIETDLKIQYNIRLDNIFRFYTVLNIPQEVIEEPYNFRKSDIDSISRNFIREYISQLSQYLNSKGLAELFELYDMEKVDKYSYLLVFGYSLINTKRLANNFMFIWLPIIILTLIGLTIYGIFF